MSMTLNEIHQLRATLDGLPLCASVELSAQEMLELLDLAEREARRTEDRTRPIRTAPPMEGER